MSAHSLKKPAPSPVTSESREYLLQIIDDLTTERGRLESQITELRTLNEELELSRNKYALLYDFAPVSFFTLDRSGVITSVNLTGATLLGVIRDSVTHHRFEQFVADKDRPEFSDFLTRVFSCRDKLTCRLKLAKGGKQPVYVRIEAMSAESGDACYAALVDITERMLADEALRESEYNLSKAQAMSHVGSWRSDPLTGELRVSNELLQIMGLSRSEATQDAFTAMIHPDDRENVLKRLKLGIEQANSYEIEHRLLMKDGTTKWVYSIVEPSVNIARQVVKLYGTTQDITERKQVEVRLRNKKNELQAIFDSVNDAVILFDHNGIIQDYNHAFPLFFPDYILSGLTCADLFHPDTPYHHTSCPVAMALRGERVETSLVLNREGSDTRYIDITANPIKDAFGEKTRALVFLRDVTLKRLQELQLIQADKMSSIGVLATGVAHEINNPLTSVAGYAEALLRRFSADPSLSDDIRLDEFSKYLQVIVRESYQCKTIIDSLLNFSRKSSGVVGRADINEILLEILELLRHQSTQGQIEVVTDLMEGLPVIHADPSELRQVCMNLLINACHAITDGGLVQITTCLSEDRRDVLLKIRDTGCGIARNVIDRIWDPFFTTKEPGKGIGLGLALTYNIVKSHKGEITVNSAVGEGATFNVRLPVTQDV